MSIGLRWNLFNGFSDKARIEESKFAQQRSSAEEAHAIPPSGFRSIGPTPICTRPQQRIDVAQASVAEAEESLRITQNRYEAGISNVTDLLRTETTVLDARTRHLAAVRDQRIAAAMLELAAGTLTAGLGGSERNDEATAVVDSVRDSGWPDVAKSPPKSDGVSPAPADRCQHCQLRQQQMARRSTRPREPSAPAPPPSSPRS